MATEKFNVSVASNSTIKIGEATTIVKKILVGTPIKRVAGSALDASTLGGFTADHFLDVNNFPNMPSGFYQLDRITAYPAGEDKEDNIQIEGNLIPLDDLVWDLGAPTRRWKSLYITGNTVYLGGVAVSADVNPETGSPALAFRNVDQETALPTGPIQYISTVDSDAVIQLINRWIRDLDGDSNGGPGIADWFDSDYINTRIRPETVLSFIQSSLSDISQDQIPVSSDQIVDSFLKTDFRTVKYLIQLEHDSDNKYHAEEIVLTHNGIDAYFTEYGLVMTDSSLGEFSANIDINGYVNLLLTPSYSNTSIKAKRTNVDA
jgi:hypothetical protein